MNRRNIQRIQVFYQQEQQALFTYSLSCTGNRVAAEDLIQQVFLKLLKRKVLPNEIKPYVFRALRNAAIDQARSRARRPEILFDLEAIAAADEKPTGLDDALVHALATLEDNEHEVIVLKVIDGLTFAEIAEVMDAPVGTVSSWHRRGLEKMKIRLEKESL